MKERLGPSSRLVVVVAVLVVVMPWGAAAFWGGSVETPCPEQRTYPSVPSDVYITGLVGVHGGGRCGLVNPAGVQVMEAARWTALKMAQTAFIPGVTLGVNIYDTCGGPEAALRAAVTSVVEGGYLNHPSCREAPHVGVLHTHPHHTQLSSFLQDVGVSSVSVGAENLEPQLEALMPLLVRLNWTSVVVAAPSFQVLQQFGHLAASFRVCVGAEAILPHTTSDQKAYHSLLEVLKTGETGGVVLIGPQDRLHATLTAAAAHNYTDFHWVLAPTGPIQEELFQGLNSVASGLLALRRASQTVPEFGEHFLTVASSDTTLYPDFTPDNYVEEPAVYQIVEAVFQMGTCVRRAVLGACGEEGGWCSNASSVQFTDHHTADDGLDVIEALSIKAQRPRYQVGYFSEGVLDLDNSVLEGPERPPQHPCLSCRCLNVRFAFLADLRWRTESWVTICATMAIIGFLLATSIAIFIAIRSCRGKAPEGSQGFSLLLLMACILLYVAILPYSFEASALTCSLRPFATSLAYALVFSIMLSRSLMLATSDTDGLVGHVSGLVQTALFFFMISVQAGLGVQQWVMCSPHSFSQTPPTGGVLYSCSGERLHFIIAQSYIMFLLTMQLFISPFIIRSRRNYHEGLLFFIATLLITSVWVAWATLYLLLPPEWSEACVCLGLAATPTVILLTIFVPKTYLMVRAAARDSICMAPMRPLSRPQSTHDLARVSSLALYDSIGHLPEMMHAPSHAYTPDPTVHLGHKESPYEAYSHYQPSPHKITQF
ncbi:bride of sevenless-like [Homarus americanus]|uniref:Bride of sevenless-like n=1 Tax=Homarus americanus TaxID=6706 RepID=A0A8J5N7X8_HOMAM|nr:bride of sevenless-like [Homarus americanus]